MQYRIVEVDGNFVLERCSGQNIIARIFGIPDEWHFVGLYRTLKEAQRAKSFHVGMHSPGKKVVG